MESLTEGYVCVEAVFLAIYLAIASMGDDEALLMRRGCVAWAIVAAAVAIVLFVCNAFGGVVSRLNWPLSGANAEGIFLVIAWFALRAIKSGETPDRVLRHGEPVILVALALTLSLGSFGALVIGAIAMLLYGKRDRTWGTVGADAAVMVVKLAIGVGTGLCLYLAPSWGDLPLFNVVTLAYLAVLVVFWPRLDDYLADAHAPYGAPCHPGTPPCRRRRMHSRQCAGNFRRAP